MTFRVFSGARRWFFAASAAVLLSLLTAGCRADRKSDLRASAPPQIVLWAWDRAEDLRFLKPGEAEVAALMDTIYLRKGTADPWSRKLPLHVPEGTDPIAVVRLESDGSELPDADQVASYLWRWTKFRHIQIDFDARASQRVWYEALIRRTRLWKVRISMTALTSWCLDEPWFQGLPDEAVPMLFQMGPDRIELLNRLHRQGAFAEGCRDAVGISTAEPLPWRPDAKRVYVFNPQRWTRKAFEDICARLR